METVVIAANHKRYYSTYQELSQKLNYNIVWVDNKNELTKEFLAEISAKYIFFLHWSHIIPSNIFNNFECIIFHMTDVPFGRGGSPLQNLISRGIYETKITALKCVENLDAGPVYLKKPLSLFGNAEEIYIRASKIIKEMIIEILKKRPLPAPQEGEIVQFQRRKPEQSNLENLEKIEEVFDYIRMLDADGYPKAFIETRNFRLEFERASLKDDSIHADVKIIRKKDKL
ncbi:methionyl-tRNA formyltransferase [Virgibacillus sp. W0181]|uniref:methionyl-tRNA formyltransferase n=1 Tax=Virgibacillus sp. W0181 TaxID=3391581 RepID=UPI003F4536E2